MAAPFKMYRKLLKLLRAKYPQYDIRVRRCKIKEKWVGKCWKDGEVFRIQIDPELKESTACDTLCHEVAHVASWSEFERGVDHGPIWGKHYGQCYNLWIDTFYVEKE